MFLIHYFTQLTSVDCAAIKRNVGNFLPLFGKVDFVQKDEVQWNNENYHFYSITSRFSSINNSSDKFRTNYNLAHKMIFYASFSKRIASWLRDEVAETSKSCLLM